MINVAKHQREKKMARKRNGGGSDSMAPL